MSLYIIRFARNLARRTELSLEWLSFVKIGSDLDIDPIYSFVRFYINGAPKFPTLVRLRQNFAQSTELGLD